MRRRRRRGSLTNRDAGFLSRLDGCPEGASFGHRGAHNCQHRVDEVVEVEPVAPTPPGAHDETQPRVPESRLPNSAHEFPPGSLTSREEERRLTGDEDLVAPGSQRSIRSSRVATEAVLSNNATSTQTAKVNIFDLSTLLWEWALVGWACSGVAMRLISVVFNPRIWC